MKYLFLATILFFSCGNNFPNQLDKNATALKDNNAKNSSITSLFFDEGTTLQSRILTPNNFERNDLKTNNFGKYLRNISLKNSDAKVKYFNGAEKSKANVYCAVVDVPIGTKDLHQCADAVMHLWARYLFFSKQYSKIQFKFLNDDRWHNFEAWAGGNYSYKNFMKYMEQVWSAANTRSLHGQLKSIAIKDARVGDVFIQTGNPYGHAIILIDECVNKSTGKKMFLLAQSYMPAQETQVLLNPQNLDNPWYSFDDVETIETPEWNFTKNDLKRFE